MVDILGILTGRGETLGLTGHRAAIHISWGLPAASIFKMTHLL